MKLNLYLASSVFCSSLALLACQTAPILTIDSTVTAPMPTLIVSFNSDGDGESDDIDECPETPLHVVVDAKGCPIVVDVGGKPDIEMWNLFAPLSSQLLYSYDKEFAKIEEILNEYPDIRVLIFGHATSNELAILPRTDYLSSRRANAVKNRLITKHHIAHSRIATYDCSDWYPSIKTDLQHKGLESIESEGRRVTLMASSEVSDLMNLEYVSYTKKYGEYAKHCEQFE